ncbi:MAG: diol dehydratase small subunit [Lachnospiraceae bacterium]|nr:diol dehydratase small subunit [Lachnospiraceae bacterium]
MNQDELTRLVNDVLKSLSASGVSVAPAAAPAAGTKVTKENYPLADKMGDKLLSPTGKKFSDMKIEQIYDGTLTAEDLRIAPETLEMQAQVSESAGNAAFATNLRRAAELIAVPDDRLLEIYNALRPYRSTKEELIAIAEELEGQYNAITSAKLVREAVEVYEKRDRLRKD